MAEPRESNDSTTAAPASQAVIPIKTTKRNSKPKVPLQKIYALPAPVRTFPLPSFYPSNPLSLVHIAYVWFRQVLSRPADEPSTRYTGTWSPETRSVHVADAASMRALWEQGFFGKGSLSRSEPNWLKREQIRRGLVQGNVQEQLTNERREERLRTKWERARIEQETIERTRLEETRAAAAIETDASRPVPASAVNGVSGDIDHTDHPVSNGLVVLPPVSPLQLLRLPNSDTDLKEALERHGFSKSNGHEELSVPASRQEPSAHMNGVPPQSSTVSSKEHHALNGSNGSLVFPEQPNGYLGDGGDTSPAKVDSEVALSGIFAHPSRTSKEEQPQPPSPLKRRKSVRFSSEVASTTFQKNDPPSPSYATPLVPNETDESPALDLNGDKTALTVGSSAEVQSLLVLAEIENREHLQLSPEEAFYLTFAIGALSVVDPRTQSELSTLDLLLLFADHSFFPPRIPCTLGSPYGGLRIDDPFLVQYVVYHHFRSLGWIPREGVKFGVDWLLYRRGPVFDHAEFGLAVIPSYTEPEWDRQEHRPGPDRSWHWLLGLQRVLAHVLKSLVLVYVDIPPPSALGDLSGDAGIAGLLKRYKVREVMVRRWSSNRNR